MPRGIYKDNSKPRGFAALTPEVRRSIASKGGKAAHVAGTAHQFTSEEAREAGKKGGRAPHKSRGGPRKPKVEETLPTVYMYEGEDEADASMSN